MIGENDLNRRLFVIGIEENDLNRRLFEDRFSAALSRGEAVASPSYGDLPASGRLAREPGYTVTYQIFRLETNLYDARGGERVGSGQSETFDPRDVAAIIHSVTEAVANCLADDGLVP